MRDGLFNVGAEALEDHEPRAPAPAEARAGVLLIARSAPTPATSSHTRALMTRVRAAMKRLIARLAATDGDAAARCARGEANPRRVVVRAYAGRTRRRRSIPKRGESR